MVTVQKTRAQINATIRQAWRLRYFFWSMQAFNCLVGAGATWMALDEFLRALPAIAAIHIMIAFGNCALFDFARRTSADIAVNMRKLRTMLQKLDQIERMP